MAPNDLIDFDIIEGQKENIQSLPGGRSAKKLADLFSPSPLKKLSTPTQTDTNHIHDCIRGEYEAEIANLSESDDPLDVFDRYVRWTLDAFPSAQATPQSQLHTLLERATKTFIGSAQYKNDPRYLRLWLHFIQLFSDAPRETFLFLSRHSIGEGLALFYEEYAAWLEGAGRWNQAEEVYKLGIEREARPARRLLRKFGEFEQRRAAHPEEQEDAAPTSPALPAVRPALAAKLDPFALAGLASDPQAPRQNSDVARPAPRSKLSIFSDADAPAPVMSSRGAGSKGWESIGSLAQRKKENVTEPVPWAGETLKVAGGKKTSGPKLEVFRDTSKSVQLSKSHIALSPSQHQVVVNTHNGKRERIFANLGEVYATPDIPGSELSFEEIWAMNRGWLDRSWDDEPLPTLPDEVETLAAYTPEKLVVHTDVVMLDENGAPVLPREGKSKKKKVMEVNETQIIKAKLDSPSGPKLKKRGSSEPTMTMHTKAATDDIYEIFNQPIKPAGPAEDEEPVEDEDDETDGDYTSGAESTGTTRQLSTSEVGDDEEEDEIAEETSDVKSVSEWSDFTARKHIPRVGEDGHRDEGSEDSHSKHAPDLLDFRDAESSQVIPEDGELEAREDADEEDAAPIHEEAEEDSSLPRTRTSFVPIPPEDYDPPTRPYRDPVEVANNRLPFMTPITERTESSLDLETAARKSDLSAKTPSKVDGMRSSLPEDDVFDLNTLSSPLREIVNDATPEPKIAQPLLSRTKLSVASAQLAAKKAAVPSKGPIITDIHCNPVSESIRSEILENLRPSLKSYPGFYDHRQERCEKGNEIRKFAKAVSKMGRMSVDKTGTFANPVVIQFPDAERQYIVRKEIGAGAFAPIYLVEGSSLRDSEEPEEAPVAMGKGVFAASHDQRMPLEAIKMETPPTAWEFHMMRLAHSRVGPQHRAAASLSTALEMHLYQDDGFLVLPFHPDGTLLDVVNFFRSEPSGAMDEVLAMFFTIELLRTVEALHAKQLLHGDLKADNCLLRLDRTQHHHHPSPGLSLGQGVTDCELSTRWHRSGSGGWASRGITLIDFGRGIDMRCFVPDVQFIADWKTSAQDCAEMREGRPWTWQIDYHGLAGIVHCLLFGKYMETVRCDAGGLGTQAGRRYKIREGLKRYWQTELWAECFDVLLNPSQFVSEEEGRRMPVLRGLRRVRERMETSLEENCERGIGLKGLVTKVEGWAKSRK